jgi:Notch-like protein
MEFDLPGSSYVGLGLGNAEMADTDMVIGWVNTDGTTFVGDFYSGGGYVRPDEDASQDLTNTSVRYYDGRTLVGFRRALFTPDPMDADLTVGILDIIYSWGGVTLRPPSAPHVIYHTKYQRVQLAGVFDLAACWYYHDPPPRPASQACTPEQNACDPNNAVCRFDTLNLVTSCECAAGFETANAGRNCSEVDECASYPCLHGGVCQDRLLGFACACVLGFKGDVCEIDVCGSAPCQQGGACVPESQGFSCACPPGYAGDLCEVDVDECESGPCLHLGNCTAGVDAYGCACAAGWAGENCAADVDECLSVPCEHAGSNCTDAVDAYACACAPGYDGGNCEVDVDECGSSPCANGAACIAGVAQFACNCVPGYHGDTCTVEVEACAADLNPCDPVHAVCMNQAGVSVCECYAGYETADGGRSCTDVDECASAPCQSAGNCTDRLLGFACACPPGFKGDVCEVDIDECVSLPCAHLGACVDAVAAYQCQCAAGWAGENCAADVDECLSVPCEHAGSNCTDAVDAYACACAPGYDGGNCDVDVDECGSSPCVHGAACNQTVVAAFACSCVPGYYGETCAAAVAGWNDTQVLEIVLDRNASTLAAPGAVEEFRAAFVVALAASLGLEPWEVGVTKLGNTSAADVLDAVPEPEPEPEPAPRVVYTATLAEDCAVARGRTWQRDLVSDLVSLIGIVLGKAVPAERMDVVGVACGSTVLSFTFSHPALAVEPSAAELFAALEALVILAQRSIAAVNAGRQAYQIASMPVPAGVDALLWAKAVGEAAAVIDHLRDTTAVLDVETLAAALLAAAPPALPEPRVAVHVRLPARVVALLQVRHGGRTHARRSGALLAAAHA